MGVVVLALVMALLFLGGAGFLTWVQETGDATEATVTDCERRVKSTTCTGTWRTAEGEIVIGGTIDGATRDDLGETLEVRLHGDRAYTRSIRLQIILAALCLGCVLVATRYLRHHLRLRT